MATETVVPDQCTDEQMEKKVTQEIKVVGQAGVSVSPPKENGEINEGQKPKAEELASPIAPVAESEEVEDKHIDLSAIVEVQWAEKVDEALGLDVATEGAPKVTEAPDSKLHASSVSEQGEEVIEKEPEEQSKISAVPELSVVEPMEHLEVPPTQEPAPEVGNKPKEASELESKIVEKPESIMEEPEVGKAPEVSESESKIVGETESAVEELELGKEPEEISESDSKVVEKPESTAEVEFKPQEKSDIVEEVEKISNMPEPKGSEKDELAEVEEILVAKVEDVTESLEEEQTSKVQESLAVLLHVVEDTKKEEGSGVDVVEGLSKEAALEVEKIENEKEEKNVEVQESTQLEATKTEGVSDSNSATEFAERTCEGVKATREVEVVTEDKKEENVTDNIPASVESTKDIDTEGKMDVNTTDTVNEAVGEPKELELEAKAKDIVEAGVNKLDKAAEVVEEAAKSDDPNLESSKDVDDSKKTVGGPPKQEAPTKSIHKQSNNIISKVKQSIVKVKKAIVGKSPSSKTLSSDAKGDIKVK